MPKGYSPNNTPHLISGLLLDNALQSFSKPDALVEQGLPTIIATPADLDKLMHHIAVKLLPKLKLYEFYVIDVKTAVEAFSLAVAAHSMQGINVVTPSAVSDYDLLEPFINKCLPPSWKSFALSTRFAPVVNIDAALDLIMSKLGSNGDKVDAVRIFKRLLETVNLPRYRLFDEDVEAILENTRSRIRFMRLDDDGPKMGEITESFVPLPRFTGGIL